MRWYRLISLFMILLTTATVGLAGSTTEKKVDNTSQKTLQLTKKKLYHQYTPITQNMWTIIASNFSLSHKVDNDDVQKQIKWFQNHPQYFTRIATQGQPYVQYIYEQVKTRGLPGELVLLPMIESAYDPFAYSWVGAAGLWQMMPATGANFGLKQDWWYDGRKDIISSTKAALDYLSYLQTFFNGNWALAIAAYNSGEGTVQNAVNKNAQKGLKTNFESLNLPAETESYVPRLFALAAIIDNPSKYHVVLPTLKSGSYFSVVALKKQIDLSQAAKLANIKLSLLYQLNPGYSRWATDPKGPYRIVLPINAVSTFEEAYAAQFGEQNLVGSTQQTAQAVLSNTMGRTPIHHIEQSIVKATPTNLAKATTPAASVNTITPASPATQPKPIQTPPIPNTSTKNTTAPAPSKTSSPTNKKVIIPLGSATTVTYKVKTGDTLWSIAKHFNVTIGQLRTWNKLSERQKVQIGQTLNIEQVKQAP
ncbi:MAG: transglycosylase SLT domain-containing protein [Legionellales bacterium]|nr:transglycosylase SLT domain-containing protein [Legionellales bacterium]